MKLSYKIHTHRYPGDKKRKNQIMIITSWKTDKSKYSENQFEYCCDKIKTAIGYGYIIIATNKENFKHIKYDQRKETLREPIICLKTFDDTDIMTLDRDESPAEMNIPISHCPFCTAKIIIECIEKKKITHVCKKVKKSYEECEDNTTEEITFTKQQ